MLSADYLPSFILQPLRKWCSLFSSLMLVLGHQPPIIYVIRLYSTPSTKNAFNMNLSSFETQTCLVLASPKASEGGLAPAIGIELDGSVQA